MIPPAINVPVATLATTEQDSEAQAKALAERKARLATMK
jgi:hypothetical protein